MKNYTAIILAGGKAKRMKGMQKAFLKLNGRRIIDLKLAALKRYFSEFIIVTNRPKDFEYLVNIKKTQYLNANNRESNANTREYLQVNSRPFALDLREFALKDNYLKIKIIKDLRKNKGPLMGIYSGLKESSHQINFITACDMPFINLKLIRYMLNKAKGFDVVVPESAKGLEPLFAIYKKSTLPIIEKLFKKDKDKPREIFDKVNTLIIDKDKVNEFDPENLTFLNINNQKDYELIKQL